MGLFDKINTNDILGRIEKVKNDLFEPKSTNNTLSTSGSYSNYCSECGTKLGDNEKFCHNCGTKIGSVNDNDNISNPIPTANDSNQSNHAESSGRSQDYIGRVLKCPHCGGAINETSAICTTCGMQITGKTAIASVQEFNNQLMELESHRKKSFGGMFGVYATADPVDKQKLTLIKNFPIPNTIDDIVEFMILAAANIDVKLSKNTWVNSGQSMEVFSMEMPKAISNAWVSKMEQVYRKAEMSFPNDPAFSGIQKMYYDKMEELKIKVR